MERMTAENIIKATLFKSTPPYVKPSKQPAAGACSQFKTPIKIGSSENLSPLKNFFFLLVILPILIPGISLIIPLYKLLKDLGLTNTHLGLILIHTCGMLPLGIFMMRNAFNSIPSSLREVAMLEGSSELKIITSVMLPLAIPGLLTVMVFAMYVSWNDYIYAFIFINSPENTMLNISLMKIALGGSQFEMKWGSLTAGSIVSFLPIIIFYTFLQQYFVRGVTGSAVKE